MPKISLPMNLEDVTANSFDALPPDTYEAEIDNIEQKIGAASKEPYLSLTFKVVNDDDFAGRKFWDNISLQEQALYKLKQLALSAGITIGGDFDTEDFLGATVVAVLDEEESNKMDSDDNPVMKNVVKYYKFES